MKLLGSINRPLAAFALAAGALVAVPLAASPASASSLCPSGYLSGGSSENFYDHAGHLAAIAYIYRYSGGTCAYLLAQGSYYGVSKYMSITIYSDNGTSTTDSGYYYDYAGPKSLADTVDGECATTQVIMRYPSGAAMFNTSGPDTVCD